MKRQVVERLFAVAGLSVLLAIGVMLSLGVFTQAQERGPVEVEVVALPEEVSAGQYVTLTAKVLDTGILSVTEMYLEFRLPPPSALVLDPPPPIGELGRPISAEELEDLEPDEPILHSIRLRAVEDASGTFFFGATVYYTFTLEGGEVDTDDVSVNGEVVILEAPPVSDESPLPTPTPTEESEPPTATPSPTLTPTLTPTPSPIPLSPSPTPTVTPEPSPTPTPITPALIIDRMVEFVTGEPLLSLVICLVPLAILLLVLVLVILARRKRGTAPTPPAPSVPPTPPPPAGPYLEGIDAAGTAHRFPLKGELYVGRAPENDLVITKDFPGWETVSRQHARIYQQGAFWIVADLQSSNGVYVNGQRTGLNRLRDECRLGIGGVEFVFHVGKEANDELS